MVNRMLTVRTVLGVIGMTLTLSAGVGAQSGLTGTWQEVTDSGLNAQLKLTRPTRRLPGPSVSAPGR